MSIDDGLAKEVPPEAHRRFRADLRTRREENLRQRAEQLALHEEKQRVIAEWIAAHGTPEQRSRHAAGVLPIAEAIELMADEAFAAIAEHRQYVRDGVKRLQTHLRNCPHFATTVAAAADLAVTSKDAGQATAALWALVQGLRERLPDATVTLRMHRLFWKRDAVAPYGRCTERS